MLDHLLNGFATALQLAEWTGCTDNAKAIAGASPPADQRVMPNFRSRR